MEKRLLSRARLPVVLLCIPWAAGLSAPAPAALPSRADLVSAAVTVDRRAQAPGGVLRVGHLVENSGRASATRSATRFYLSRDRARSRDDARLEGQRTLPALRPGARSRTHTKVRIARRNRAGLHWVFACADAIRQVRETSERNNCRRSPRRVRVKAAAKSPVVSAAGDIACDPSDPAYADGQGTADRCRQMQTSRLLAGSEKVLALGDLQYQTATLSQFNQVYDKSWGRFKSLTSPAIGNHEYDHDTSNSAQGYFDYFNGVGRQTGPAGDRDKGYYSYNLGSWHLVSLNSNCGRGTVRCEAGSAQEQWLRRDLAANPGRCTLAYWHHPLFTSTPNTSGTNYATPAVAPLWKALREHSVDVLLTGHAHTYERFARMAEDGTPSSRGVRQFVIGSGGKDHGALSTPRQPGSEFSDGANFGVLKLTLGPGSYSWGFKTEGGTVLDPGSEACI